MDTFTPISDLNSDEISSKALLALGIKTFGDLLYLERMCLLLEQLQNHQSKIISISSSNAFEIRNDSTDNYIIASNHNKLSQWDNIRCQLSIRTQNGLNTLGVETTEAFLSLTREQFLAVRGIGITCWKEVHKIQLRLLNKFNISNIQKFKIHIPSSDDERSLSIVKYELRHRQHILDKLGIRSFSQLRSITREDVTSLNHVGIGGWKKLQNAILKALSIHTKKDIVRPELISLEDFPLFGGMGIGHSAIPESFFPDKPVSDLNLSLRSSTLLDNLHLKIFKEVLMTSPEVLLANKNFGIHSLSELRNSIRECLIFYNKGISIVIGGSFIEFLSILYKLSNQPKRRSDIFLKRFADINGDTQTYEKLAKSYGYTRERIRQILKTILYNIEQNIQSRTTLEFFHNTVRKVIDDHRGIIGLDELGEKLANRLHWCEKVPAESLRELFKSTKIMNDITMQDGNVICEHPCRQCDMIINQLHILMDNSSTKIISIADLANSLLLCDQSRCARYSNNQNFHYSDSFIKELSTRAGFVYDEENIYSVNVWALKQGGLNRKVEAILNGLKAQATSKEVWEELRPYLDISISSERIHSALINSEDIYLWGRGKFIHKNHIHICENILPSLKDILQSKLHILPFVALHGIFQDFRITLEKARIPNEYALGTVIALYLREYFHVDRYHYIYMNKPSKATSIDAYIEQWIRGQEGEVKRSDLNAWMMEQIGVRESVITLSLGRLDNIITTKKGYLIHIDNTGLNSSQLSPIYQRIQTSLAQHQHIGINRLYKEQQVTCFKLNIVSSNMLYAVMRYYFSEEFDFTHYPHICRQDQKIFNDLGQAVSQYIKEQNTIVSINECVQYFEEKGYSPIQLRARLYYLQNILPYYPGCVVHEDTIGWDIDKADQLYHTLSLAYFSRLEQGYWMGDLENVYDMHEDQLPKLSNNMNWTAELLYSMATRFDEFEIIGNAKRAYSIKSCNTAIHNLAELVVKVVRNHFGGGCSQDKINQWMQENGVIRKQLNLQMFNAPPGLIITEYEYLWKGE